MVLSDGLTFSLVSHENAIMRMPITLMVAIGKAAWNLWKRTPKRWLDGLPAFAQ